VDKVEIFALIALASGKNVLLVGAPGVGKTRLAKMLAGEGMPGFEIVTCREGLTYDRIVAYYSSRGSGVSLELGPLTKSLLRYWLSIRLGAMVVPGWIVLDEVNRVNIDVVLGEIFTAMDMEHRMSVKIVSEDLLDKVSEFLSSSVTSVATRLNIAVERARDSASELVKAFESFGGVPLPYSYRFLATMNIYDRAQLYRLGHAFVRRFAYIYILPPYESCEVTWSDKLEPKLLASDTSKSIYSLLTSAGSEIVRQAVKELEIHRHVKSLIEPDSPMIYIESPSNLATQALEYIKSGGLCDKGFKLISYVYGLAGELGVELGISPLVDAIKMCIATGILFSKHVTDKELADLMLSSLVIPQLGVIAPRIRAEALLGSEELLKRVRELRKVIEELLGMKSLSYRTLRGLVET